MFHKFEKEIETLTERSKTMGIEEFLLDEAEKKGIEKGREGTREETTRDIALKMKNSDLDISLIANITGLSVEEIQKL
jgi:predicted transposase/invertase (TIGR01784 family)